MPSSRKKSLGCSAIVVASTAVAIAANAQSAPAGPRVSGAPATSAMPSASVSAVAPAIQPVAAASIATPEPGAPPAKVEKAKEIAKVAELTPIVPNPKDATHPAFQLYAEIDLPVLGIGAVFGAARLIKTQKAYCAPLCDPAELNGLDALTAGWYNPAWSTASDFGLYGTMLGSAVLLLADEGALDTLNDAVVIAESALSATAVASMMTLAAGRPRPLLYGTKAPIDQRNSADASLSFLSGHATATSAVVMSTFIAMKRLHPKSALPYVVLAVGGALSTFVASARVLAGKHFITDAAGGLVVGSSMGTLVSSLHDAPVRIVPIVSDTQRGLGISGAF